MMMKQTIKLKLSREDAAEKNILACEPNSSNFVDDKFYQAAFKETPNSKSALTYSTQVKCMRADWIIQDSDDKIGYKFLKELIR